MDREPGSADFYDADVPTDANPSRLRRVILAQAHEPGGAAVLLFTSATLADAAPGVPRGAVDLDPVEQVARAAQELGTDPGTLELFTADAYLLQSALGERLLPDAP